MNTLNALRRRSSAFTLIELLVVIGLIALLAGGMGVAMKNKNPGSGLRSAQSILVSLLSATRGQAALNQNNAMILVQANPDQPNFLRSVKVVVETSSGTDIWQEMGGEVVLPEGIYVVPPIDSLTGADVDTKNKPARLSEFVTSTPGAINGITGTYFQSMKLTSLGGVTSGGNIQVMGKRMLVAAGTPTSANTVKIDNTSVIRGFVVSKYGVATLINDTATLDVAVPTN